MANNNKAKETANDEITKEVKTEVKTAEVKSTEVVAKPNDKVVKDTKVEKTKVEKTEKEPSKKPAGNNITVIAVFGRVDLKTTIVDTVTPVDVELTPEVKAALRDNLIKKV